MTVGLRVRARVCVCVRVSACECVCVCPLPPYLFQLLIQTSNPTHASTTPSRLSSKLPLPTSEVKTTHFLEQLRHESTYQ